MKKIGIRTWGLVVAISFLAQFPAGALADSATTSNPHQTAPLAPLASSSLPDRRINVPFFGNDEIPRGETAILWLGNVTRTENYADVRIGYNNDHLLVRVAVMDRLLWYDTTPEESDLAEWDAVTLYLDQDAAPGGTPDGSSYRFRGQLNWWRERDDFQVAYIGNGGNWSIDSIPFTTSTGWRSSSGPNDTDDDRGWVITFEIPFSSLGLSGAPEEGSVWRLGVMLHDRDDAAGSAIPDKAWPEDLGDLAPTTWGEMHFGMPQYTPPDAAQTETYIIRHKLENAQVPDAHVGGGTLCGDGLDYWTEWGDTSYPGTTTVNIQNQYDIADWPCFSKYYLDFPLDSLPAGRQIISATLRLHNMGHSGSIESAQPSLMQVLLTEGSWQEETLTWNNGPLATENIAAEWVHPVPFPGWPGTPIEWDVSHALIQVYGEKQRLQLVLYDSDTERDSGKYFVPSDTGDWNELGRPTLEVTLAEDTTPEDPWKLFFPIIRQASGSSTQMAQSFSRANTSTTVSLNLSYAQAAADTYELFLPVIRKEIMPEPGAGDWPMLQHDPQHSGRTPATIANDGPLYLQWAYAFGERLEVEAQPIVANGVLYQGVMNGELHALDAATGQVKWISRPGGPIAHAAAVDSTRVYTGSLDGSMYALAASDGHTIWRFETGGPIATAPLLIGSSVYIGSMDGNLYALDAGSGAELWRFETGGPVLTSPAHSNGSIYFGSQDMFARKVDAETGALDWASALYGAGLRHAAPVVSDDGGVVIFQTIKPGATSYEPMENCPNVSGSANPVTTWNNYYQAYPERRYLYFLDAGSGAELWQPQASPPRYVPLPVPYWGLIQPVLDPDGDAYLPVPSGAVCDTSALDRDDRLLKIDLSNGLITQVGGGSSPEYQLRTDETGRHVFAGEEYYYSISEDVGVFRPDEGSMRALFTNGDPSGYNFGTHMDPHSPLPSRHLWRYGGAITMGGVPGASAPIVANDMLYFNSYSWLYAVGPQNHGYDPATSFPARDARTHELTYPRAESPSQAEIEAELDRRVADIIALGPENPPMAVRWEQPGAFMLQNEFTFELYGFEADLVRALSLAYPHLSTSRKADLRTYLSEYVQQTLVDPSNYGYIRHCLRYGESFVREDNDECIDPSELISRWWAQNPNLSSLRLHALWIYADQIGDWDMVEDNWSLVQQQFQRLYQAYDPSLGFCDFDEWESGRLNIAAQIAAVQAVREMAQVVGDTNTYNQAGQLLNNLLAGRLDLAAFVPNLYDSGLRDPKEIRLDPDGTLHYDDIMGPASPYNMQLIPYDAALRNRDTDPSQVNWWDGSTYRVEAAVGYMHYPGLSGYFPLSPALVDLLKTQLLEKTRYYVNSYEVNNPWWWMSDLAHHTTAGGEHLYHSPTLAWTLFQTKAWVLGEDWDALAMQLPMPNSANSRYDLFRMENLATLIELTGP